MLAGWCPVVWAASVIGELNRPPPPAMVLGVLPLLQDADLAAGQQYREPVMLLGRPHFTAPQRGPVQFDKCHGSVRARAVQAGTGHNPVVTVDDLDTRLTRCSMDEYPVKSTRRGTASELQPVHRTVITAHIPGPVHIASNTLAAPL
jgi:hypothetical protein